MKKDPWQTTPNARRHRKMVHVTMSQDRINELDERRGELSRGAFIEFLLDLTLDNVETWRTRRKK